jgi:hypothetical protein
MKIKRALVLGTAWLALSTLNLQLSTCSAQGTAFTYQGRLNDGGNPAHGAYDFRFKLYEDSFGNTQAGGTVLTNGIPLTNGLFTVTIDFGAGIFNGSNYWLGVGVRTNGGGGYTDLNPLQAVTPTPYAIFAITASNVSGTISSANLSGAYGGAVTFNNASNSFSGAFAGDGANVTNVNAAALGGLGTANFWKTTGNAGTTPGVNFVGTSDNQPLELRVNGGRALRIEPNAKGAPNMIGGSPNNYVSGGLVGATIGGGGATNYSGTSYTNSVTFDFGTVSGGYANLANGYAAVVSGGYNNANNGFAGFIGAGDGNTIVGSGSGDGAFLGGGYSNTNGGEAATIVGGTANFIGGFANNAFIGGGGENSIMGSEALPVFATISGGQYNTIQTNVAYAAIGGGYYNTIQTNPSYTFPYIRYATIGGGAQNTNRGNYSVIGGGQFNFIAGDEGTIGGGQLNTVSNNYAVIGGGANNTGSGISATVGGGVFNYAGTNYATVAGGGANAATGSAAFVGGGGIYEIGNGSFYRYGNTAGGTASVVGGGLANIASGISSFVGGGGFDGGIIDGNQAIGAASVIGGGLGNLATNQYATVGGGYHNTAGGNLATVSGGDQNNASGNHATVDGGFQNAAGGSYATVPGGFQNAASGSYAFAAGVGAQAAHNGAFVWADSQSGAYSSDRNNQFKIRAGGGMELDVSGSSGLNPAALYVNSTSANGVGLYMTESSSDAAFVVNNAGTGDIIKGFNGGGSPVFEVVHDGTVYSKGIALTSDRNAKENFQALNPEAVLEKVASLPVSEWNYRADQKGVQHVGPMAQDFHAAFGLNGDDEKHISMVDEGGVALAAIQGLNQKLEQKAATIADQNDRIRTQAAEIEQLKQSVAQLQTAVAQLTKGRPN